jgi:hypothetical protein
MLAVTRDGADHTQLRRGAGALWLLPPAGRHPRFSCRFGQFGAPGLTTRPDTLFIALYPIYATRWDSWNEGHIEQYARDLGGGNRVITLVTWAD